MRVKQFTAAFLAACLLSSCGSNLPEPIVPVSSQSHSNSQPSEEWKEGMCSFSAKTSAKIFSDLDEQKNALYSPASLYLALSGTTALTSGNTQAELLSLLEADSVESLGKEVSRWRQNLYSDQSGNKVLIDGSIWLDNTLKVRKEALNVLADQYHTAAFQMDLNDPAAAEQMAQWVREATKGMLGDPGTLDPSENAFSLLSTLYFYSKWEEEFSPDKTASDTFFMTDGTELDCKYMNIQREGRYSDKNGVKTAMLPFENGAYLVFALPEEGTSPVELAEDPDFWKEALLEPSYRIAYVDWKVPKFEISSKWDGNRIIPILNELGVLDVFGSNADFSILTPDNIFVHNILQETVMTIDEKGGEAAAYTVVEAGSCVTEESQAIEFVEMHLTRPFLFALMLEDTPLFTGIINNPLTR